MRVLMVVLATVTMAVAACGFQPSGQPGDAGGAADGDADGDGPQPGDGDGDGVVDDADNCPAAANADQHDEDADGRGDACDPCPQLAGALAGAPDADADADGIGDGCDPRPDLAGDQLVMFEPFAVAGPLPAAWQPRAGSLAAWEVLDDAIEIQRHGDTQVLMTTPPGVGLITVDAVLDVVEVATDGDESSAGVVTGLTVPPAGVAFVVCGYRDDDRGRQLLLFDAISNPMWRLLDYDQTSGVGNGTRRVTSSIETAGVRCVAASPEAAARAFAGNVTPPAGPAIGLRVVDMHVRIPYVAIYRSPS